MKRTPPSVVLLAVLLGGFSVPSPAQIHRVSDEVRRADLERRSEVEQMVMVPMRDGVRLATEVYLPREGEGPFPAIFWRTPYNFSRLRSSNPARPNAMLKYALDAVDRGCVEYARASVWDAAAAGVGQLARR